MKKRLSVTLFLLLAAVASVFAQNLNDKLMNRPYTDMRKWHLGFSIGAHTQDISFTHNGFVTDGGEQWFMEQPAFSPGFCVNGLIDYRLSTYLNLRFTPGMYFGNRDIKMREYNTGATLSQNLKSTYVVLPLDLKFSGMRLRNARPYVTGGFMAALDVAKKTSDYLKTNTFDAFLTVGFGCDFYLPFFKFIPEIKFCFGLRDILIHDRPDLVDDPEKFKITQSLAKARSNMVVFTFYFE
ncbi:MAG: PorT family protein [Bacteroides sp.]|nr:PorT family protein [Bacteroidales bacterium]MBD5250569.1 PorT family protein [Barnesiella sp.]MBD5253776.1 PorT family protein [Barnesiella sp.]MBD5345397.1 PorT family protein [Bacteroides sp.]MBD5368185.1 PorT family protein [Bacteroides sp.]